MGVGAGCANEGVLRRSATFAATADARAPEFYGGRQVVSSTLPPFRLASLRLEVHITTHMTLVQDDSLADVERNRLRLEVNIAKLRVSLQHWQTWEAEYEGLKEEIEALDGAPTTDDLVFHLRVRVDSH